MEEHQFLVGMRIHIFILKIGIEFFADPYLVLIGFGEDSGDRDIGHTLIFGVQSGAFLGESFRGDDMGLREGCGPGGQKDVVLKIGRCDVGNFAAEGGKLGLDAWG